MDGYGIDAGAFRRGGKHIYNEMSSLPNCSMSFGMALNWYEQASTGTAAATGLRYIMEGILDAAARREDRAVVRYVRTRLAQLTPPRARS